MLKYIAKYESTVEGKVGHFLLDHDTPICVAKEMAFQFLKYLGQIEDQARAQQEAAKAEAENTPTPIAPDAIDPPATELVA